jgi:signal transduction protein with GAF and PtsI domain
MRSGVTTSQEELGTLTMIEKQSDSLANGIDTLLREREVSAVSLLDALDRVMAHFDCAAGTLHGLNSTTGLLELRAARNIPPTLLGKVQSIPIGKGMAGLAAERRQPVQVCNLQTDASGAAKPSARETRMEGSIAVPLIDGSTLAGVLGIAKPVVYEFTSNEIVQLAEIGAVLARYLSRPAV